MPTYSPEIAASMVNRVPVVVVHTYGDRHVRRVYLTLAAASRAVERGHRAYIVLARIVPEAVIA